LGMQIAKTTLFSKRICKVFFIHSVIYFMLVEIDELIRYKTRDCATLLTTTSTTCIELMLAAEHDMVCDIEGKYIDGESGFAGRNEHL
jgi:hypothetical protein